MAYSKRVQAGIICACIFGLLLIMGLLSLLVTCLARSLENHTVFGPDLEKEYEAKGWQEKITGGPKRPRPGRWEQLEEGAAPSQEVGQPRAEGEDDIIEIHAAEGSGRGNEEERGRKGTGESDRTAVGTSSSANG